MPIYEFECRECRTIFDKLCSISSGADGVACPECGSGDTRKLISAFYSRTSSGRCDSCSCESSSSSCDCGGCTKSSCSGCH